MNTDALLRSWKNGQRVDAVNAVKDNTLHACQFMVRLDYLEKIMFCDILEEVLIRPTCMTCPHVGECDNYPKNCEHTQHRQAEKKRVKETGK